MLNPVFKVRHTSMYCITERDKFNDAMYATVHDLGARTGSVNDRLILNLEDDLFPGRGEKRYITITRPDKPQFLRFLFQSGTLSLQSNNRIACNFFRIQQKVSLMRDRILRFLMLSLSHA